MDGTFLMLLAGREHPTKVAINMSKVYSIVIYDTLPQSIGVATSDDGSDIWMIYDERSRNLILEYLKRNALGTEMLED
jgi:hypothetical protein